MTPLLFDLSAAPGVAAKVAVAIAAEQGQLCRHEFPDGETYLRFESSVRERQVVLLCTLDHPDAKLASLVFAAAAAKAQGARTVGLLAPYLAYMRQDQQFHLGEAVTSQIFARLLSRNFDWLVTVDPHLHRYRSLAAIYSIPAIAATAVRPIADWIVTNVERPVLIGPDEESRQWVEQIAGPIEAPWAVLRKIRSGDRSVHIDPHGLKHLQTGTPVLVDDIASTGSTLIGAVQTLMQQGSRPPQCAVVHAIFAEDSYERLHKAGAARVVSTNTIAHESNAIDVTAPLADAIRRTVAPSD